ncbi:putative Small MutS-related domain [Klebsormidium nitens]|uniref:Putative Small MutS-related domain n=1 Tax=Klebsormidium nitens TaxID=105231 RepID=A0A1Y1HYR8_KLENI|nr:putative Small MutS-related domain [Klebsormidium nitens]|eukprot:GAQ83794.1 putative Small MutS-related domain [Klebsormidium nitens]
MTLSGARAYEQAATKVGRSGVREVQAAVALKTSGPESRSEEEALNGAQKQSMNGDSALPWAMDSGSKSRPATAQKRRAVSKDGKASSSNYTTQQRLALELSGMHGGEAKVRLARRVSARQQLLELDRERGEEIPACVAPHSERGRRPDKRQFQRGGGGDNQKEWRDDARLARRAVEAILASQGLDKQASVLTAVETDAPEEGLDSTACGGEEGRTAGGQMGVNGAPESGLLSCWGLSPGLHLQEVESGKGPVPTADENSASSESGAGFETAGEEKKAALARTLEALGGSLSLYRWQDVLKDLGERGHWAVALNVFYWAQENLRIKPNAFTYAQMAMTLQAAGQAAPLIALYDQALRHGITPPEQLFNGVISAHCQQGDLPTALEVFAQMTSSGCKPGQWTYTYLLQGCARWDPGLASDPGANLDSDPGLNPNLVADPEFESGLALKKNLGFDVEETLGPDEGGNPGFDPFVGLPDFQTESGPTKEADLKLARGQGGRIPKHAADRSDGRDGAPFRSGEGGTRTAIEIADGLVQSMLASRVRHNLVTLTALVEVYAGGEHVARALELFGRFPDHGVKPDGGSYLTLFQACVRGGASLGQLLEVYWGFAEARIRPPKTVYHPLLRACAQEKNLAVAHKLFDEMRAFGIMPDAKHYTSLVFACGVVRDIPRAEATLTEMLTQGLERTTITWNALLSGLRKGEGTFAQMKPVVKKMRAAGAESDCTTYSVLLQVCKQEGRANTAQRIYAAFLEARSVPGERILVHREALENFAPAAMVEACETVIAQMRNEGLVLTRRMHQLLIAAYAAELDYGKMADALAAMLNEGLTPGVAANDHVARALARGGRVGELLVLLKTIREGGGEVPGRMWHHVIRAHVNVPDQDPDLESLSKTLRDLHRTSGSLPTAALVSLLILISQADTWQQIQPLVSLLGRIDGQLFQAASELLSAEPRSPWRVLEDANRAKNDIVRGSLDPDEEWAVQATDRFVRLVQAVEPDDSSLLLVLLGRTADALCFRGLRARAATLVRTVLTLELNRAPHGGPIRPSDPVHVARSRRLDLHRLSEGGACALLLSWLRERQADVRGDAILGADFDEAAGDPPAVVEIVTGWGKHSLVGGRPAGVSAVQAAVGGVLEKMGAPFETSPANEGLLVASSESVREWLTMCPAIELRDERK